MFKKSPFLVLFIIACLFDLLFVVEKNVHLISLTRVLTVVFLGLHYVFSVKKINYYFVVVLLCFLIADFIFCFHIRSITGFIFILLSRAILLRVIVKTHWQKDWQLFFSVFVPFVIATASILTYTFSYTFKFYLVIIIALLLALLFTVLFIKLTNTKRNGVLELFVGVSIFIVTDAIFAVNKIETIGYLKPIMVSILYHLAYYFLCDGMIKKKQLPNKLKA